MTTPPDISSCHDLSYHVMTYLLEMPGPGMSRERGGEEVGEMCTWGRVEEEGGGGRRREVEEEVGVE